MKQKIKVQETADQKVYFISDLHWGHDRDFIWGSKGRSYKNVTEMNDDILSVWNSTITDNDIVFNLGDMVFGDSDGRRMTFLMEHLKCKKHYFLWGNHVSGQSQVYKTALENMLQGTNIPNTVEIYPLEIGKFVYAGNYLEIEVNNQPIVLTHYPILSWHGSHKGSWNIFGHTHCTLKKTFGKQLDVGWDFKKRPILFSEIKRIMDNKETEHVDQHT